MKNEITELKEDSFARWAYILALIPILGFLIYIILMLVSLIRISQKGYLGLHSLLKGFFRTLRMTLCGILAFIVFLYCPKYEKEYSYDSNGHGYLNFNYISLKYEKNGMWTYYYDISEKKKESEKEFKNGLLNGRYVKWFSNGKFQIKGQYINGKKSGKWKYWHKDNNDKIEYIYDYIDDENHYYKTKLYDYTFIDGGKHFKETHPNHKCKEKFEFVNSEMTGNYLKWNENGKIIEGRYFNSEKTGKWTWWYENGNKHLEGTYSRDIEIGKWTSWYDNGDKESERTYNKGKEDGLKTIWYIGGLLKEKGLMKDNKKYGEWHGWHKNNKKSFEISYDEYGQQHGCFAYWHVNGIKKVEEEYIHGVKNKTYKEWTDDGKIIIEEAWENGSKIKSITYYENGNKKTENHYNENIIIYYYKNGRIKSKGKIKGWNKLYGQWIYFSPNGEESIEILYEQTPDYYSARTGYWVDWWENGNKKEMGRYIKEVKVGQWLAWYKNGQKKYNIEYVNGKAQGNIIFWDNLGNKITKEEYDNLQKK